jgi:hypothetical protein
MFRTKVAKGTETPRTSGIIEQKDKYTTENVNAGIIRCVLSYSRESHSLLDKYTSNAEPNYLEIALTKQLHIEEAVTSTMSVMSRSR